MTLNVSQHVPTLRNLRPPVPEADTGGFAMIQFMTSSVWMFCSVMMSPEYSRERPHPRRHAFRGPRSGGFDLLEERILGVIGRLAEDERARARRACTRRMASMNGSVARVWKSTRKHRWLAVAFAALCSIVMQPGTSTADRLGQVDVLARGHRVGGLDRMEERRALDRHRVELLLEQPAIGGQSREAPRRRNAELVARGLDPIREVVGQRDDVVAAVLLKQVGDPAAAPAAADDAEIHLGTCALGHLRSNDRERKGGRAGLGEEVAAREPGRTRLAAVGW